MNDTLAHNSGIWRPFCLMIICALPALAWFGILDDASSGYVDTAFTGAGIVYGTARGINALVSVLQGTELDFVFVTAAVGEVLDPVNDLIERFSGVVLIALGSLALQKLLLGLVSHNLFNTLMTLLALASAWALWRGQRGLWITLLRYFLVAAFLRFSLGLVVLANSWVDNAFLLEADQQRHAAMEVFRGELRKANAFTGSGAPSSTEFAQVNTQIKQLETRQEGNRRARAALTPELAEAEKHLAVLISADRVTCTALTVSRHTCSAAVIEASNALEEKERLQKSLLREKASIKTEIDDLNDTLDCLRKRTRGENCGLARRLSDALSPAEFQAKIAQLEQGVEAFVANAINLLVSLLLKSIAIPIAFFLLLLKLARLNLSRLEDNGGG